MEISLGEGLAQSQSEEFKTTLFVEQKPWPRVLKENFKGVKPGDHFEPPKTEMVGDAKNLTIKQDDAVERH